MEYCIIFQDVLEHKEFYRIPNQRSMEPVIIRHAMDDSAWSDMETLPDGLHIMYGVIYGQLQPYLEDKHKSTICMTMSSGTKSKSTIYFSSKTVVNF